MNGQSVGYLVINSRYANSASPVKNSDAVVRNSDFSERYSIAEDGKSETLVLPVGSYTVTVSAEGFFDKLFYDTVILPGATVLINAELFPEYDAL